MERRLYRIDEEGNRRDDFADDLAGVPGRPVLPYRFHPSERGHALVSQLLLPVVKELLAKR